MQRRKFLAVAGAALVAGCGGDSDGSAATETPTATPTPTETPTATQAPTETPSPTPTPTATPRSDAYDPEFARDNAREPSYDELFRSFEEYEGVPIRFDWGVIYQTIYEDGYDYYQMQVSQGEDTWEGDIAATWYGDERYLENDALNPVIGVAEELLTYETTQGNERTIPRIEMVDAELYEE